MRPPPLSVVALLFVASGWAGLIDQVCFSKFLSYVVGSTAHAVSAVLAAFMAGLALGAKLGGSRAMKVARPLFAYGVLELVVGLAVLVTPYAFDALSHAYVSLVRAAPSSLALVTLIRWLLAVIVVIVPTTAMGATLPLLSRLTEQERAEHRGRALGVLYACNTLGGALGSLGSSYWILPALGLRQTTQSAALTSVVVGLLAMALGARQTASARVATRAADAHRPPFESRASLDIAAFASGALVFACEVIFVHLLVLLVGTSAYAFGVILSIFLVCLFLGAALAPYVHKALGLAALPLGLAAAALALTSLLPVWAALPDYFKGVGESVTTFEGREMIRGAAALVALFIPTTLMGLTFPLLLQSVAHDEDVGALVGRLTAVNTVGAVAGSLFTGYVLLPRLGSQRAVVAVAIAFAAVAILTALRSPGRRLGAIIARAFAGSIAVLAILAGVSAPRWDLARMTGGYHVYFDEGRGEEDILFTVEDTHGGVTTVTEQDGVKTLLTNGKFQGNDGLEMYAQRSFAHYPGLFVRHFDRALVIGLGTGTTLGTVASYPFRQVEVAEISPAIVRAAKTYFGPSGADALSDPRVTLAVADGRNHLLVSDRQYDFIGIELTSVWFAGAGSLYSREFYQLCKARMKPDGIFQQWIQLHHIEAKDLGVVMHTLRLEFAHVVLFYGGGQGILVASNQPLVASRKHLAELQPTLGDHAPDRPLSELLDDILVTTKGIDSFVRSAAAEAGVDPSRMVSTDDNLYLEYATPRGNVLPWSSRSELLEKLVAHRSSDDIKAMLAD